mgnify:CR=1 FL=1
MIKQHLKKLRKELAEVITYHEVVQYLFFSQWAELKAYANVEWYSNYR